MLDKSLSPIEWAKTPREVIKQIYGLQPWPVATAELDGKVFKIYSAEYTQNKTDKSSRKCGQCRQKGIEIACLDGETVLITELQAAGKKRMKASDYLLGHPIKRWIKHWIKPGKPLFLRLSAQDATARGRRRSATR